MSDTDRAVEAGRDDVERLRRQNHEHAERRDREMAGLQSEIAAWRNAAARARELVRGSPVDWTNDPPSREPDGWWRYTSANNRAILTAAVHAALASSRPAAPDSLDVAWKAAEAALIEAQGDDDGFGIEIAYWSEFPDEPWAVSANGIQATGASLPAAFAALAAALPSEAR